MDFLAGYNRKGSLASWLSYFNLSGSGTNAEICFAHEIHAYVAGEL